MSTKSYLDRINKIIVGKNYSDNDIWNLLRQRLIIATQKFLDTTENVDDTVDHFFKKQKPVVALRALAIINVLDKENIDWSFSRISKAASQWTSWDGWKQSQEKIGKQSMFRDSQRQILVVTNEIFGQDLEKLESRLATHMSPLDQNKTDKLRGLINKPMKNKDIDSSSAWQQSIIAVGKKLITKQSLVKRLTGVASFIPKIPSIRDILQVSLIIVALSDDNVVSDTFKNNIQDFTDQDIFSASENTLFPGISRYNNQERTELVENITQSRDKVVSIIASVFDAIARNKTIEEILKRTSQITNLTAWKQTNNDVCTIGYYENENQPMSIFNLSDNTIMCYPRQQIIESVASGLNVTPGGFKIPDDYVKYILDNFGDQVSRINSEIRKGLINPAWINFLPTDQRKQYSNLQLGLTITDFDDVSFEKLVSSAKQYNINLTDSKIKKSLVDKLELLDNIILSKINNDNVISEIIRVAKEKDVIVNYDTIELTVNDPGTLYKLDLETLRKMAESQNIQLTGDYDISDDKNLIIIKLKELKFVNVSDTITDPKLKFLLIKLYNQIIEKHINERSKYLSNLLNYDDEKLKEQQQREISRFGNIITGKKYSDMNIIKLIEQSKILGVKIDEAPIRELIINKLSIFNVEGSMMSQFGFGRDSVINNAIELLRIDNQQSYITFFKDTTRGGKNRVSADLLCAAIIDSYNDPLVRRLAPTSIQRQDLIKSIHSRIANSIQTRGELYYETGNIIKEINALSLSDDILVEKNSDLFQRAVIVTLQLHDKYPDVIDDRKRREKLKESISEELVGMTASEIVNFLENERSKIRKKMDKLYAKLSDAKDSGISKVSTPLEKRSQIPDINTLIPNNLAPHLEELLLYLGYNKEDFEKFKVVKTVATRIKPQRRRKIGR